MKDKKALFFDIDGTLVSDINYTVPDSTVQALARARAKGHEVFINTGRVICSLPPELNEITFDGILCGCGTYIEYKGEVVHKSSLSPELCKEIVRLVRKYKLGAILEGEKDIYFPDRITDYPMVKRIWERFQPLELGHNDGFDTRNIVFDKLVIESTSESDGEGFLRAIKKDMDIIDRGEGVFECVQKNHSKATAIDFMLARLNLGLEDAYVFGDSSNDLPMFEHVPNAIAMGKHSECLAPHLSFVTKTVEDGGICYAMEQLGII